LAARLTLYHIRLMKNSSNHTLLILIILALLSALVVNESNLHFIEKENPTNELINCESTLFGKTVWSVDNIYYLSPAENYIKGNGWKSSTTLGKGTYFRRVPGYSILYYGFRKIFGKLHGVQFLKYFQLIFFLLSVIAIYRICHFFFKDKFTISVVTGLYGITPFFSSYTYFSLTESISPFLVVFFLFFLLQAYHNENRREKLVNYIISSFFIGFAILTRPYIGLAAILLPVLVFMDHYKKGNMLLIVKQLLIIGALPLLMILSWTIRNYVITKEVVPLEKAYHPESLDRFKPEFKGFFSFVKCWGEDGYDFNKYQFPLWVAARDGDTSRLQAEKALSHLPLDIISLYGKDKLMSAINKYQQATYEQKQYLDKSIPMPGDYLPKQLKAQKEFEKLISEYKRDRPFNYWVVTPLIYFRRMVFHSNTSHIFLFQNKFRQNMIVNSSRIFLALLHIGAFIALFINLLLLRERTEQMILVLIPFLFIIFFCTIHREIEQRYMLPILPLIIIGLGSPISRLYSKIGKRKLADRSL